MILERVSKDIGQELSAMCAHWKRSILRVSEPSMLLTFSWESLQLEVKESAPSLYAILDGVLELHEGPSRRIERKTSQRISKDAIIGLEISP